MLNSEKGVIKKYRVDDVLHARMQNGQIYTWERHFKSEDFYITPSEWKTLRCKYRK